jgi:uncharacterized integral membrane protein (TIGR00697 family)
MPVHVSNELTWVIFLLLDMVAVVAVYRFFGKEGIYAYVVLAIITCNIEVVKFVEMFGVTTTLGNILYGSLFLTSDILAEIHGRKVAQRAVWLGFIMMLLMTLFMQISLSMEPASFPQAQAAQEHLNGIFHFMPRIAVGSLTAYLISQLFDVWIFVGLKLRMQGRMLWLRNNAATLLSQAIDTVVFCTIAFAPFRLLGAEGLPWSQVVPIAVTTYILKVVVSIVDTPFVYWARAIARRRSDASKRVELDGAPA